jgi:hypothetical protein
MDPVVAGVIVVSASLLREAFSLLADSLSEFEENFS